MYCGYCFMLRCDACTYNGGDVAFIYFTVLYSFMLISVLPLRFLVIYATHFLFFVFGLIAVLSR